jgi:hypothetical protein
MSVTVIAAVVREIDVATTMRRRRATRGAFEASHPLAAVACRILKGTR